MCSSAAWPRTGRMLLTIEDAASTPNPPADSASATNRNRAGNSTPPSERDPRARLTPKPQPPVRRHPRHQCHPPQKLNRGAATHPAGKPPRTQHRPGPLTNLRGPEFVKSATRNASTRRPNRSIAAVDSKSSPSASTRNPEHANAPARSPVIASTTSAGLPIPQCSPTPPTIRPGNPRSQPLSWGQPGHPPPREEKTSARSRAYAFRSRRARPVTPCELRHSRIRHSLLA